MSLLDDIETGETETARELPCPLCTYIAQQSGATKEALIRASAGTMGLRKLEAVLQKHETGVGRRTIERHRREEHTP